MKRLLVFMICLAILVIVESPWAQTSITVCSYGGTYNKGLEDIFGKPFTEATGIKVVFTTLPTFAQMTAQVQSGNIEWDIVECEGRMYARGVKAGLFEPLDLSGVNARDFVEGSVTKFGLGLIYYSYNICYTTTKWPAGKGPKNMQELWDVKSFPGPRTMNIKPVSSLEAGLLADGVPKDKIYPMNVERALKKLDELKPHIRVYWKNGGHVQQVMREREADLGYGMAGRIIQLAEQGVPLAWEWNDQMVTLDSFTVLKGSKKKEAAMKFIAYTADPKRQAAFAEYTYYGPANKKAYDFIKKEKAMQLPTYPENLAKGFFLNDEWYAEHEQEVERMFDAWKMK